MFRCKSFYSSVLLGVSLMTLMSRMLAQSATGTLEGNVSDPSGARVADVAINLLSIDGTTVRSKSDRNGHYLIQKIVPAT